MSDVVRIRRKMPTYNAALWLGDGSQDDIPGVTMEKRESGEHAYYLKTAHRALWHLKAGYWLVWDDDGVHQKPCVTQDEFDRLFEVIQ